MPGRNGMGPMGMGARTGRGMGPCGMGYGRGFGRGCRFVQPITKEEEIEMLKQEKEAIEKRLEELK